MPKRARAKEKINLYGQIYEIKKPTVAEAMNYDRDVNNPDHNTVKVTVDFLNKLGLPKRTAYDIQAEHLSQLVEDLLGIYGRTTFMEFQLAKMASFYGWTHEYLMGMEAKVFMKYFRTIQVIEAQDQLASFTAHDWPNFKKGIRKEIFGKVEKLAKSVFPRKKVKFTKELLESIVNQHKR